MCKFEAMRIIFMGTPEFAVPSLARLLHAHHEVVAVVTAPDRPSGRGRKLTPSPVKQYAQTQGIPVLQPEKLRDPAFLEALSSYEPDLMVVVAFRMLPEVVWSMPTHGTFNLHASLLPDYRGAAPINWVIMNGERTTGATTFLIDQQIDTGNLLLQRELDLPYEWSAGDLHDALMELGADLVLETVEGLAAGRLTPQPQDESKFQHKAPKIFKEDCRIDWQQPAERVYNHIRGLSPYPGAWTTYLAATVKLFATQIAEPLEAVAPGTIRVDRDELRLWVAAQDRWLEVLTIQMPGKKRLATADFLRGYKDTLTRFA